MHRNQFLSKSQFLFIRWKTTLCSSKIFHSFIFSSFKNQVLFIRRNLILPSIKIFCALILSIDRLTISTIFVDNFDHFTNSFSNFDRQIKDTFFLRYKRLFQNKENSRKSKYVKYLHDVNICNEYYHMAVTGKDEKKKKHLFGRIHIIKVTMY